MDMRLTWHQIEPTCALSGADDLADARPKRGHDGAGLKLDQGFDPEAELIEILANFQAIAVALGVDSDNDGGRGGQEAGDLGKNRFQRLERVPARDEADGVMS